VDMVAPPFAYYPLTTSDGKPITTDKLSLTMGNVSTEENTLFSMDVLQSDKMGYNINNMLVKDGKCYGAIVNHVSNPKAKFFLPVRPVKIKLVNPIQQNEMGSLPFPSLAQLTTFIEKGTSLKKHYHPIVRGILQGDTTALFFSPDTVAVYLSEKVKNIPFHVDPDAVVMEIDSKLLDVLWGEMYKDVNMSDGEYSSVTIRGAEAYVSEKIIRNGEVPKIIEHIGSYDTLYQYLLDYIKPYTSKKTQVPLRGRELVMYGDELKLTPDLSQIVAHRLAARIPKNPKFVEVFLRYFTSIRDSEWGDVNQWEKTVE